VNYYLESDAPSGLIYNIPINNHENDPENNRENKNNDAVVRKLIALAQSGAQDAKETLVKRNVGLIWSIVKRFSGRGYEADDLFQIGSIGLIKCIEKFDLGYDVKFSTYAVPMILGEIRRFIRDDGLIKVSRPLKEIAVKAKYARESITQKTGRQPTIDEIAAALGIDAEELVMALDAGKEVESLYSTVNGSDDNPVYLLDRLDGGRDEGNYMVDKIALKELIRSLGERERQVIIMRYFQDKTQSDVAKLIGVSQVQVSRIEKRVLRSLRQMLTE